MLNIVSDPALWRTARKALTGTLGFVPTMGNLHDGHMDLVRRAQKDNDHVVVSIFVNPTQFNDPSDFEKYQRTLQADCKMLEAAGVEYVFAPDAKAMYPENYEVRVSETVISNELEGEHRPGHFTGMLTVVLKLFNIIQPDRAYFGEKDYQQMLLVSKMCRSLFIPVQVIPVMTRREDSGLAMSSRNGRLSADEKARAARLSQVLLSDTSDDDARAQLEAEGFAVEYVATRWGRRLAAVRLGDVRLIDNVCLGEIMQKKEKA